MSGIVCRLCSNSRMLMDIFDDRLTNSEQLRKCVLLATGVEICADDVVTKFICKLCSDIAILLYKYRQKAIAHDISLKNAAQQKNFGPFRDEDDIVKFNTELMALLNQNENQEVESKKQVEKKRIICSAPAVHPTVIQLIKECPTLKVPNQILQCDIQPQLILDKREAEWKQPAKPRNRTPDPRGPIDDVEELFKLKCPGIQITKVSQIVENVDDDVEMSVEMVSNKKNHVVPCHNLVEIPQTVASNNFKVETSRHKSMNVTQCTDTKDHVDIFVLKPSKTSQTIERQVSAIKNSNIEMTRNKSTKPSQGIETKNANIEMSRTKSTKTSQLIEVKHPNIEMSRNKSTTSQVIEVKKPTTEMSRNKSTKTSQGIEAKSPNIEMSRNKSTKTPELIEIKNPNVEMSRNKSTTSQGIEVKKPTMEMSRNKSTKTSHGIEAKSPNIEMSKNKSTKTSQLIEINPKVEMPQNTETPPRGVEIKDSKIEESRSICTKISPTNKPESFEQSWIKYMNVRTYNKKNDIIEIVDTDSKKRKLSESSTDTPKKKKVNDEKPSGSDIKKKPTKKRTYPPAVIGSANKQGQTFKASMCKPNSEEPSCKENAAQIISLPAAIASVQSKETNIVLPPPILEENTRQNSPECVIISDDSERILPKKLHRKNIFESDNSDTESIGANDTFGADDTFGDALLDTVDEEIALHCTYCNRLFNTESALKNHERVHKGCSICNGIFRNEEALRCHQQEMCFKSVIANPPKLQLTRVDEQPEMLKRFSSAFARARGKEPVSVRATTSDSTQEILCISDDEDDDDVILVQDNTPEPTVYISQEQECEQICAIYRKYKNVKFPMYYRTRSTVTKPQVNVRYNQKNQIVLDNMYPELLSYRVPVELIAKPNNFACISFTKKTTDVREKYCWKNEPITILSEKKKKFISVLLSIPATQTNASASNNTITLSGNNIVEQFVVPDDTLTASLLNRRKSVVKSTSAKQEKRIEPACQIIESVTETLTNDVALQGVPSSTKESQRDILQPVYRIVDAQMTDVANDTAQPVKSATESISTQTVVSVANSLAEPVPKVAPSTSDADQTNSAQPPKEVAFSLRVKTPWELNTT